jgi:hypothetical protein
MSQANARLGCGDGEKEKVALIVVNLYRVIHQTMNLSV